MNDNLAASSKVSFVLIRYCSRLKYPLYDTSVGVFAPPHE